MYALPHYLIPHSVVVWKVRTLGTYIVVTLYISFTFSWPKTGSTVSCNCKPRIFTVPVWHTSVSVHSDLLPKKPSVQKLLLFFFFFLWLSVFTYLVCLLLLLFCFLLSLLLFWGVEGTLLLLCYCWDLCVCVRACVRVHMCLCLMEEVTTMSRTIKQPSSRDCQLVPFCLFLEGKYKHFKLPKTKTSTKQQHSNQA